MSTQGTNEHEGDTSGEERGCQNSELSLFQYGSQSQYCRSPNLNGRMGGNYGGGGGGGEYHLPTSNLPPQHRLESSSRIQLQLLQPYYPHYPPHMNEGGRPQWPNCQPHHQTTPLGRTQEIQFRGLVGPGAGAGGTNSFYPTAATAAAAGPSSYQIPNTPQRQQGDGYVGIHPNQSEIMEDLSSRNVRMRMTMQDNGVPYGGQLQLGSSSTWFNPAAENPNPPPRPMRNSVYDPMYEEMGLPVDPHLRMFLAKRNQGKD